MPKISHIIEKEADLGGLVDILYPKLQYPVILLFGELAAAKTTLVKAFLHKIGTEDSISSPSYSIINHYNNLDNEAIYHIDLYRMDDADEVMNLGIEEYLYSGCLCFIEWPQIILDTIDEPYHILRIEILENNSRKITLT